MKPGERFVMDETKARALGQRFLETLASGYVTTEAEPFERCWIVFWSSEAGGGQLPPGSAPLLVDRSDESVHRIGSAPGYDAWARYYDRFGTLGSAPEIMQFSLAAEAP